jgi:tetratricopeptide (TPR) repeat protein
MRYCLICKRCYDDEVSYCEADGAQTAGIMPGSRTLDGKYEISRLLGQGGMGAVFEAVQRGIERQVAIKLINPSFVANEQALERFKREALASGRVKHPNAITVYDFGVTSEGVAFLAMEFLRGSSLRDELSRVRVMEPQRVVELLAPVCAAVESAHRQNIVHRDLKPDNIFLERLDDDTITPKVLDFGIAKLRTAEPGAPDLTGEGSSIGTPAYMSPEQAKGLHLDARSDVYALGVIAYEMLSGALPFQSTSPMGFLVQHMMEAPIPLSAANPRISAAVEEAVMRALDKAPDARPQSALEFGRSLARAVETPSAPRTIPVAGFQETVSLLRKLGSETIAAGRATLVDVRLLGWPVGLAPGVEAAAASDAFAELARELVAAAAQRVPYDVVFQGACHWAEQRLSPLGLVPPGTLQPVPGAAPRTAGIAFYCAQEGLAWTARMPSGSELPLLLRTPGDPEPHAETAAGIATYYVPDLPGGHTISLVARLKGKTVWSSDVGLVDGATTLVLCVPEPDLMATQNPEMFALLFGTVEVTANEAGAEIFVDGGRVPWGVTSDGAPVLLYCVVPGRHHVEVRRDFFVPVAGEIDVVPGQRAVFVATLQRSEARLALAANVAGAAVEIVGPDPSPEIRSLVLGEPYRPEVFTLPSGGYTVRAIQAGYAPWMAHVALRQGTEQRLEVALQPVACPLCGAAAGSDVFTCPSCRRENVHAFHRYERGVCIDCAARGAFDRARATGTADAWRGYLDAFRSANLQLTRQAEHEIRRMADAAREAELAERAERFARLAASGGISDIVASWRRVVVDRPADPESHLGLAMALEAAGDRAGALAGYHAAAERAPADAIVRRELARLLAVARRPADAIREYTVAVNLRPDFAEAHFELANLLASTGQFDAAVEGFRHAAASRPKNPVFHESFARALAERGRFREASAAFRESAACYRRDGNLERAARADAWAERALAETTLHKAGTFIKDLFK